MAGYSICIYVIHFPLCIFSQWRNYRDKRGLNKAAQFGSFNAPYIANKPKLLAFLLYFYVPVCINCFGMMDADSFDNAVIYFGKNLFRYLHCFFISIAKPIYKFRDYS